MIRFPATYIGTDDEGRILDGRSPAQIARQKADDLMADVRYHMASIEEYDDAQDRAEAARLEANEQEAAERYSDAL